MRMEEQAAAIRAEISALPGQRGPGNRYPLELRERIVEYTRGRRKQGLSIAKISLELEICIATLRSWTATKRAPSIKIPSAGFERLEVVETAPRSISRPFVVRGPAGLCIEGLDIDMLAELIRRLS